jgi:beta-glucosidase
VYNAVNGPPGCASTDLLQKRLRDEWGFQGYVVSDCGAVNDIYANHKYKPTLGAAAVAAVKAGTDLTCGLEYASLVEEVKAGHIAEAELDRSLARLFVARFRLGMFDPQERVPYSKIPISENDSAAHRKVAREAERKAIVLLKNTGGVLPLGPSVRKIAVIGPSADDPIALLGNYHGISSQQVTPFEGIERQFKGARVRHALGATYTASTPALLPASLLAPPKAEGRGVLAEYFDNPDLQGTPKLRRIEPRPYFDAAMEDPAVLAAIGREKYSLRWTTTLTPPASGEYEIGPRLGVWNRTATAKLFLDDKEVKLDAGDGSSTQMTSTQTTQPPRRNALRARIKLEGGRKYAVRVEYRQPGPGGTLQLRWQPPAAPTLSEAESLVKDSDVAIVCVGLSAELEGEEMRGVNIPGFLGGDRTTLDLPEPQERLVKAAIATGKPVVVVLTSGSAIASKAAVKDAAALLQAWYGGEETGSALAETLAGVNNPAGRLPVTFYQGVEQLPPFTDYAMKGRSYRYFKGEPLYPFGFGLSYSSFAYSDLVAKRSAKGAEIRATVKNTSKRDGDEVVQLYVSGGPEPEAPIRSLRGFQRVRLRAGESRQLSFTVPADDLPKTPGVEISVGGGQPLPNIAFVKAALPAPEK